MRIVNFFLAVILVVLMSNSAQATGDCNADGTVTISEVQSAINMFLGINQVLVCVDENSNGNVTIDEVQKTINSFLGLTPQTGHLYPYPGATHRTQSGAPSACQGCHDTTSVSGSYPVAIGTAPKCAGCHMLSLNIGCSDCHGDATTGRPNLASSAASNFPRRRGQHQLHGSVGCTNCHPFTTKDPRHGWSNGVKSSAAQVGGAGTFITTWTPPSPANSNRGSCLPQCHGTKSWY